MAGEKHYVIDFDSTFTQVEALDELGEISLRNHDNKHEILKEVSELTNSAMGGGFSFAESLRRRLALLQANQKHLPELVERLLASGRAGISGTCTEEAARADHASPN